MAHDETPDAGDEWTAKAILMGVELIADAGYGGVPLWAAKLPGHGMKLFFGVTQARACRKFVRHYTGASK